MKTILETAENFREYMLRGEAVSVDHRRALSVKIHALLDMLEEILSACRLSRIPAQEIIDSAGVARVLTGSELAEQCISALSECIKFIITEGEGDGRGSGRSMSIGDCAGE